MVKDKPSIQAVESLIDLYGIENFSEKTQLTHYGKKRRSGRYPWGSGEDPYQHEKWGLFLDRVDKLQEQGWKPTPANLKAEFGEHMTSTQWRKEMAWAKYHERLYNYQTAKRLQTKGCEENGWKPMTATEIAKKMGMAGESSVRSLLDTDKYENMMAPQRTADQLKELADKYGMIDVSGGSEDLLGINKNRFNTALHFLEKEGYHIYPVRVPQATNPGQFTTQNVLAKPDVEYKDAYKFENIKPLQEFRAIDGGDVIAETEPLKYPVSMDSKRLAINYKEQGGIDKDGVIEIRRGVKDLALVDSTGKKELAYAQVRILVDGTHYLKGMAVYSNDLPKGVDVVFNTNKKLGTPMQEVLKSIKDDPDDPFGSLVKEQNYYTDKNGKKKQGLLNYRAIEGDWDDWKNSLPSQFLSKQPVSLAKKQLDLAKKDKLDELKSIQEINNPVIRKYYLQTFADNCDSAAESLKAAALPGQHYRVLLALPSMKETEVFAPGYDDGTKLALVRYPHGGTFEIPILTVNNRSSSAKKVLGSSPKDAVMVNSKVAEQLSGADFDGDTVMCIPTHDTKTGIKISSRKALDGLKNYDPKDAYGSSNHTVDKDGTEHYYDGSGKEYPIMGKQYTQKQMGIVSNLITDMHVAGANDQELARAVRHSMTVIDANKHKLNYKLSEVDNDIDDLKKRYQKKADGKYGGASTLLSRSKSETHPLQTQGEPKINLKGKSWYDPSRPEGALIYKVAEDLYEPAQKYNKKTGKYEVKTTDGKTISYDPHDPKDVEKYAPVKTATNSKGKAIYSSQVTNKDGTIEYKTKVKTRNSTQMRDTDDARTLISPIGGRMEYVYADYANSMKSLANQARKEYATTSDAQSDPKAKKAYANEVASLKSKLSNARKNAPIERQAQRMANAEIEKQKKAAKASDTKLTKSELGKISQKAISKYREEYGSIKRRNRYIPITDKEWEAIQSGAVASSILKQILNNTDPDELRERATPSNKKVLNANLIARIRSLGNMHYTQEQIARICGVSASTVNHYLKGES